MSKLHEAVMPGSVEQFLELHRRGLRLVPLRGKAALVKNWPALHLGEQDVRDWAARGANFGILTGEPLVVLDTDTDAAEAWVRQQQLESPVMVQSGGGGLHRYFLAPPDAEIHSASALHRIPGLDVKGWRSYVVAAGSVHPETGLRYEYLPGCALGEVHALPTFDVRWIVRERPHMRPPEISAGRRVNGHIRDVRAYLRGIRSVQGEGGDRQCYTASCLLAEAGYSPTDALAELRAWNVTNAFPPWTEAELRHKVRRAFLRVLGTDIGTTW